MKIVKFITVFCILCSITESIAQLQKFDAKNTTNEFRDYVSAVEKVLPKSWENLSMEEKKHLAALTLMARIKNPVAYRDIQLNNLDKVRNGIVDYHLGDKLFLTDLRTYGK